MRIESDGHSRGNPRLYELIEHAPKTGKSPTVWAWPELIDYLKVARPAGGGTVAAAPAAPAGSRGRLASGGGTGPGIAARGSAAGSAACRPRPRPDPEP